MAEQAMVELPENGAEMDYDAHDKTYAGFLRLFKWSTAACLALMIAMAVGFFAGGGLVGGTIVFVILTAVAIALLR